jgi:hypothetical protein
VATSILERTSAEPRLAVPAWARWLALEATIPAVLFASAAIIIGLHWDIAWHRSIGRDTFWSPPHVMEQVAASVAGLLCGWRVIYTSFFGPDELRAGAVRWWGLFYGPLGGWICIWGTIAMITSAPFDNWWHAAYGLDVKILTPPHVFLLLGMATVQLGAMVMMLAEQNRAGTSRAGVLFSASMGLIVLMGATTVYEYTGLPNLHHSPLFYEISAGMFPILLVAVGRAGRIRWPATTAALTYMIVLILLDWVLVRVPAVPKLAPIYNPVTHLTPPGFPVWLVVPAFVIDLILHRLDRRPWLAALAIGPAFVAALLAVQWPFSAFVLSLDQPNAFFASGYWDYQSQLGLWTTKFFDVPGYHWQRGVGPVGSLDFVALGKALLFASVLGMAAARIGLWWGGWMRRVKR